MNISKRKKRIFIIIGMVVMILGAGMMYLNHRNRTLSPPGNGEIAVGDLNVSVSYSRPSVRGRVIFGPEADGALQPWGQYWRLGANESTEISFSKDVSFGGKPVDAGIYKIYAVPGEKTFQIILNTSLGDWGYSEADHDADILTIEVPVINDGFTEQHTIDLISDSNGVILKVAFEKVILEIPIEAAE